MLNRRAVVAIVATALAIFVLFLVDFSSSFVTRCLAGDNNSYDYGPCAYNYAYSLHNGLIVSGIDLILRMGSDGLTAAATCVIAAFTFTLWRATTDQGRLTRDTIDLGNREFAATHRPRIRVRHVTLDRLYDEQSTPFKAGEPVYGRFEIVNVGDAEARVTTWGGFLIAGQEGSPPRWPTRRDADPESEQFEAVLPVLSPGVYAELRMKTRHPLSSTLQMDLTSLAHGVRLYAIGRITYEDTASTPRTTEFCRCWRMPNGTQIARFNRVDDPDFEYED